MLQFRAKVYRRGKFSLIPNAWNRRIMSWRWCEIMSWKRSVCLQFFLSKRVGTIQWSQDRVAQPSQLERAYSPLWGCAGDRVKMVVKVHCGTVLGGAFSTWRQFCPQNSPTMHFDNHLDPVSRATSKWRIYEKKCWAFDRINSTRACSDCLKHRQCVLWLTRLERVDPA